MGKTAVKITLCICACAMLGSVCFTGACVHECTDGDASAFAEGIAGTIAYDGSYTGTAASGDIDTVTSNGEKETDKDTGSGVVTYDASSGPLF
ncbi:MAG: hypothetical protein LUD51_05030 [Clostridia bacterium]|nr:hypothetical protein [Clostridia bacterium]